MRSKSTSIQQNRRLGHSLVSALALLWFVSWEVENVSSSPPTLQTASYQVKSLDILGTQLDFAVLSYTFDQDLYLPVAPTCAGIDNETDNCKDDINTCICDYTSVGCNEGIYHNNNTEIQVNCTAFCEEKAELCDGAQHQWTDLQIGERHLVEKLEVDSVVHFRYFLDEPCTGFQVAVEKRYGEPVMYINTDSPADVSNYIWEVTPFQVMQQTICSSNSDFQLGTYFISVTAPKASSFYIEIRPAIIPSVDNTIPANSTCQSSSPNHKCLLESVPLTDSCPDTGYFYYMYPFTGCQSLSVSLSCHGPGTDADLYASLSNDSPNFGANDFYSFKGGDDLITVRVCPANGAQQGVLWMTVDCWNLARSGPTSFTLLASSKESSQWKYRSLASISDYDIPFHLLGTARIQSTEEEFYCDNWSYGCLDEIFPISPNEGSLPFWPVPPTLNELDSQLKQLHGDLGFSSTPSPRTFKMIAVTSYTVDGATTLTKPNRVSRLALKLVGRITNENGEGIVGSFQAQPTEGIPCDYDSFSTIREEIASLLEEMDQALDPLELLALRFRLDSTKYKDSWSSCQSFLAQLVTTSSVSDTETALSESCYFGKGTPQYETDPCCNYLQAWRETCVPRLTQVPVVAREVNYELVDEYCQHPECIGSYLEDYSYQQNGQSLCSRSHKETTRYQTSMYQSYRDCKDQAFGPATQDIECSTDANCTSRWSPSNNITASCDSVQRKCHVPLEVREATFARCLLQNMDKSQELYVRGALNLSSTYSIGDERLVNEFLAAVSTPDCVVDQGEGLELSYRSNYLLFLVESCLDKCTQPLCEDTACPVEEGPCQVWCGGGVWKSIPSNPTKCSQHDDSFVCNWDSQLCSGLSYSSCSSLCTPSSNASSFCGFCRASGDQCYQVPSISDPSGCAASQPVCLFPNGTLAQGLSQQQCEAVGQCTQPCPPTCSSQSYPSSEGVCVGTAGSFDSSSCSGQGGEWNSASGLCIFPSRSRAVCESSGALVSFKSCSDLSLDQCWSCQPEGADEGQCSSAPVYGTLLQCFVNNQVQCQSETECTSQGGTCSDWNLLADLPTSQFGACVVPPMLPVGTIEGLWPVPFCDQNQQQYPNSCSDFEVPFMNCTAKGGQWMYPSYNKSQCLSSFGCYDSIDTLHGIQFEFSPKDKENCLSSYNAGTWKNLFNWSPGKWMKGTLISPEWIPKRVINQTQWRDTINFPFVQDLYFKGASLKLALESKSEALCKDAHVASTLIATSCDCADDGDDQCFAGKITIATAQAKPCQSSSLTLVSPTATLYFSNESIVQDCIDVLVSELSALYFQETIEPKLSTNFAPIKKPEEFAVLNSNNATVGVLLGDGTQLLVGGTISGYTICFHLRKDLMSLYNSHAYPIYDIAQTSPPDYATLTPLEVQPIYNEEQGTLCQQFTSVQSGVYVYFPIARQEDYEDKEQQLFEQSYVKPLLYTLAVFFLLTTLYVTLTAGLSIYDSFLDGHPKINQKLMLLAFLWLFLLIRTIYFFIIPQGIDSQAIDYILAVLPTFFYFTAFTLIVVIWAVSAFKKMAINKTLFKKTIRHVTIGVNASFYLLFIIIVLVFHFSSDIADVACKGRVEVDLSSIDHTQRVISIVYASLIAIISLSIGSSYVIFGVRLYKQMSRNKTVRQKSFTQLFMITGVCSGAFILHCVFILVLVGLKEPNMIFSFIGLIITELLPSIFMATLFGRSPLKRVSSSSPTSGTDQKKTTNGSTDVEMSAGSE